MRKLIVCIGSLLLALSTGCDKWPPPHLTLDNSEWECTRSHTEVRTRLQAAGKVMVPLQYQVTICDQYTRSKA